MATTIIAETSLTEHEILTMIAKAEKEKIRKANAEVIRHELSKVLFHAKELGVNIYLSDDMCGRYVRRYETLNTVQDFDIR